MAAGLGGEQDRPTAEAVDALEIAGHLPPFPAARESVELLAGAGLGVGVLTNSSAESAVGALRSGGLHDSLGAVIGVDAVEVFKPHPRVYLLAVERLGVDPDEVCMVSAHGWDVMGASRAGLRTAWVARKERKLAAVVPEPDIQAEDL